MSKSEIRIIAVDTSTHAVVPRRMTQEQWDVSDIGTESYTAMVAAAPPTPPTDVVKRLEWERESDTGFFAQTPIGPFFARRAAAPLSPEQFIACRQTRHGVAGIARTGTVDEAMDACQREFNRLVTECLAGTVGGGG